MCENQRPRVRRSFYSVYVKRWLDILLSSFALVVLLPLLMLVCLLELIFHGRPVIYKTSRPGKDGKVFYMYKFRSMTNERGADGLLLPESKRLTKFGYFLRKTSIDELPGLINILKGDMSVIGPRPLLTEYLKYYNPRHAMRHSVRPGLALGRIRKSDSVTWTWREQFENDIYYVEHISFIVDLKMVFAVIKAVFQGDEYRAGDTRVPFDGTNLDETRGRDELGIVKHFASLEEGTHSY